MSFSPIVLTIPGGDEDHARATAAAGINLRHGRATYRLLEEPLLTEELIRLANPRSPHHMVDTVSFQPLLLEEYESTSEDRVVVEEWKLSSGSWLFNAVFDGHLNDYTVDEVAKSLPATIKHALRALLHESKSFDTGAISLMIRESIMRVDIDIRDALLDILPHNLDDITDEQIKRLVNDNEDNYDIACRCLGGTTVVLSLTDPTSKHCWIATLGDSVAVLAQKQGPESTACASQIVNSIHNCTNPLEVCRVTSEHPGEIDCLTDGRVLGFLEPTRAIGDIWLKIPESYTSRVFANLDQSWVKTQQYAKSIRTPPYVSNIAEVSHFFMTAPFFMILCSDGFTDLHESLQQDTLDHWVDIASNAHSNNAAMVLLRHCLGGNDVERVSKTLTLNLDRKWIDDVSIVVQKFER